MASDLTARSPLARVRPLLDRSGPDLLFFVALFALLMTWVVAVPPWAVPDEPAHVFKAFGTADGQGLGEEIADPAVPANIRRYIGPAELGVGNISCFVFHPDVPAGCVSGATDRNIGSSAARAIRPTTTQRSAVW